MSFIISAMPQSIYQPLGTMNLPNASLDTLSFESYQQKQDEALRIDPAVEARQVQEQRAQDQAASHNPEALQQDGPAAADISPIQSLESLFLRQQMISSIAAGEQMASKPAAAGLPGMASDKTIPGAVTADTPVDPESVMTPLSHASSGGAAPQALDDILSARNTAQAENSTETDAEAAAKAREQQEQERLAAQDKRDEMLATAKEVKEGKLLGDEDDEKTDKPGTLSADPFRAAIEHAAAMKQTLSESRTGQTAVGIERSTLAEQVRTDSFIAEVHRMQAQQFGSNNGRQLSIAA